MTPSPPDGWCMTCYACVPLLLVKGQTVCARCGGHDLERLDMWECRYCGEKHQPKAPLIVDDSWWEKHETYGVRRCGPETPDEFKLTCPLCKGSGKHPKGTGWDGFPGLGCLACNSSGKINRPDTPL